MTGWFITERMKDGLKQISCESAVEGTNKNHRFTSTSCCSYPIRTAQDLDYQEIEQLIADEGKDEVYGWHFLSTLAAKNAA